MMPGGLNTMRAISDLMADMPDPDATPQQRRAWLTRKANTYRQIAAWHQAIAAEATHHARIARLDAAAAGSSVHPSYPHRPVRTCRSTP